jgi:catechol 2,3-dioxygenase-like lactoylglutathione lyase family enzyme
MKLTKGCREMTGVQDIGNRAHLGSAPVSIESISAITLATHDMARSVRFYRALGFRLRDGGEEAGFTSFEVGGSYLNVCSCAPESTISWWGRAIFYVSDVDAFYEQAIRAGLTPQFAPRDATWGERYFHLTDPDGHELSFARPLE